MSLKIAEKAVFWYNAIIYGYLWAVFILIVLS